MRVRALAAHPRSEVARLTHRVFYGWWLVGLSVFTQTLMSVSVFQGLGTFLVALERQFGWSRTALSGAFVLARAEGAILGPMEGFLIDRFGSRRLVLVGYIIMGIGFILLSQVHSLWHFYGAFMVITLGSGLGGWLAMITVINNWFVRRRSFALAMGMTGVHLGGFLVPVLALGIESHGFRWTTFGIGVFLLATVGPVTRAIRNRPEDHGLRPDGDPAPPTAAQVAAGVPPPKVVEEPDFTVGQALRTPAFWLITTVQVSSSVSIVTLSLHLVPKLTDMGLSLSGAGVVVLTYTALALPSQFVFGYIADRVAKPPLIFACLVLQAVAIMVIALAESVPLAFLFAVLYGIGFGGRIPLMTAIRGDYFGRKAFAKITGLSQFPSSIAMMGAPLFAGYMYDTTGSYFIPFTFFAILNFLGAFPLIFVRKPKPASVGLPARGVGR